MHRISFVSFCGENEASLLVVSWPDFNCHLFFHLSLAHVVFHQGVSLILESFESPVVKFRNRAIQNYLDFLRRIRVVCIVCFAWHFLEVKVVGERGLVAKELLEDFKRFAREDVASLKPAVLFALSVLQTFMSEIIVTFFQTMI